MSNITIINNISNKNISRNLSNKYSPDILDMRQKPLDHAKQSATDAFETASKRAIPKTAEAIGDVTGNEIADKITNVSKKSQQNNSETVTNQHDKEVTKERHISPKERQKIIDNLVINIMVQ